MEKLIEEFRKIVALAQQELDAAKTKNAEANQLSAAARIEKNRIEGIKINLDKREVVLEQSESPIEAAAEARRLKSENINLSVKINEERHDFEKRKQEFSKYVSTTKADLAQKNDEVSRQREEFKRLREELKEKEENLRDQILEEIKNKVR